MLHTSDMRAQFDGWTIDGDARTITGPDGTVHVEPQVFDVLLYLISQRERVVPNSELLDQVWGDQFVSESALTTRIKEARKAIGDDGRRQRYIRNVPRHGYQFVGDAVVTDVVEPDGVGESPTERPTSPVGSLLAVGDEAPVPGEISDLISVDTEFPFVGRAEELDRITAAARSERVTFTLIGGEPGIGKSRLAAEAANRLAADGAVVCAGRCEQHMTSTVQPIRDGLAEIARRDTGRFQAWIDKGDDRVLQLIPTLAHLSSAPADEVLDQYTTLEILTNLLGVVSAQAPLVILIDDLQWSDEATRVLLARLRRRLARQPISVLATFRSGGGDLPGEVRLWLAEQLRHQDTTRLDLTTFDRPTAEALIQRVLPEDKRSITELLVAETGGHGLFLTERLREALLGSDGGRTVELIITDRLGRLAPQTQEVIRAASVLGPEFVFDVAAAGASVSAIDALAAIEEAMDADMIHEASAADRFRFAHQLVADAIRDSMSPLSKARVHHGIAHALAESDSDPADVAYHLLGAVPLVPAQDAIDSARKAAQHALSSSQFDRSSRLLQRILEYDIDGRDRAEVLVQLGHSGVAAGRAVESAPIFEEAAVLARRHGWPDILAEAAIGHMGRSPYRRMYDTTTLELLAEADAALDGLPEEEAVLYRARILAKRAVFSALRQPLADGNEMTKRALELVPGGQDLVRLECLEARAILLACPMGYEELRLVDPELESLRAKLGVYNADAAAPETLILMQGRGSEFRDLARLDEARVRAQPIAEWRHLTLNSTAAAFAGEFDSARRFCDEAGAIGPQFWGESAFTLHALGLGFIASLEGDWDAALTAIDPLVEAAPSQHHIINAAWMHLEAGDVHGGSDLAARIKPSGFEWHGQHILGGNTLVAAAEIALILEDDQLAQLVERHLEPFEHLMLGLAWGCARAAADPLARLATRRGDTKAAERLSATATELYERLEAPALLAAFEGM